MQWPETIQGFYLMILHVFFLSKRTSCSLWRQSASDWMKHHTGPSPKIVHTHNLSHNPPPTCTCQSDVKIADSDSMGMSSSETHTIFLCVYPSTPRCHFITFSLMNSQMILVISSPSISTTGWDTLMRLSASVNQTYRRGFCKNSFSFPAKWLFKKKGQRLLSNNHKHRKLH